MIEQIVVEGMNFTYSLNQELMRTGVCRKCGRPGSEAESDKNGRVLSGRVLKSVCPHILSVKR